MLRPKFKLIGAGSLLAGLLIAAFFLAGGSDNKTVKGDRYLVGAYYYSWYPSNFGQGYLRGKLKPPQVPVLGHYHSEDVKLIEQHIAWCSRYGIDFLAIDWWPSTVKRNEKFTKAFLQAENLKDIKFCIFYETWELGFNTKYGATIFDQKNTQKLISDITSLADKFFNHPGYLKVQGRPVIMFYLTRTFHGDYFQAFRKLREALKKKGYDPYFIADEVFWGVMSEEGSDVEPIEKGQKRRLPYSVPKPQMERIKLFDAVTAYNMYDDSNRKHAGYGATSTYAPDIEKVFAKYKDALKDTEVKFVPNVLPGYNDRGVRHVVNHYVIPRQWAKGDYDGSFLAQSFDRLAFPYTDPELNMILLTSWNEWNEDTQIEPVRPAPEAGPQNKYWTEGFRFIGYGDTYLKVLRDKVVAVSGRVTDGKGMPVQGVKVCAYNGEQVLTTDETNKQGYFSLSRLRMSPGNYEVGPVKAKKRRQVEVEKSRTSTGVDFVLQSPTVP